MPGPRGPNKTLEEESNPAQFAWRKKRDADSARQQAITKNQQEQRRKEAEAKRQKDLERAQELEKKQIEGVKYLALKK